MPYIYAQIDPTGVCFCVSVLSGEVLQEDMINIADHADPYSLLGQIYDRETGTWSAPAEPVPEGEVADE